MSKQLFDDFPEVSAKQWKQKIQFDLKGADYNNTLIWNTIEDIDVKPFYHADDFSELPEISNTKASQWKICETIFVQDAEKSNLWAKNAIEHGAESINFKVPSDSISIESLLKDIRLDDISIQFDLQFLSTDFVNKLIASAPKSILFHNDIIGHLVKSGNWFNNFNHDFLQFINIFEVTHSFSVNASRYQNAGATMVQQLAYSLAHANEYLNSLNSTKSDAGNPSFKQPYTILFNVAIGSNYFFEIAKLRALRLLWNSLASQYGIPFDCQILATPTMRNKTLYDYNTNMLRTTTECMSAILGGANTISNLPYDSIYHKSNPFGERIARNQLLILKHESYFKVVDNPCDGAYYIESLTQQLAHKALLLFKNIEANGGFLKQLKEGTIQRKIRESAHKELHAFIHGHEVLVGTNKYPNPKDHMKDDLELYPFVKRKSRKTLIEPVIEYRLSEEIEKERLKKEQYDENKN
ncbi:methylmalonyl-CoA mutase subunit beta [Aestuariivivens sediminis]|uniref:methylmalonyl-CoA mutase subunit beta n=1 Tax=Aestuariivivens sediminis TaxID=2913557 RepID=UPI001F5850AA|nr:methylmalonyl-CoA mutase subunit beta [Aestuariivivens sediminis]